MFEQVALADDFPPFLTLPGLRATSLNYRNGPGTPTRHLGTPKGPTLRKDGPNDSAQGLSLPG